jgi:3-phosphoshikimate 1-carboxyvinyltransferase
LPDVPSAGVDGESLSIGPSGPLRGEALAPPSKSMTNRLLVVAALATGESRLLGPLVSDDSLAMVDGLRALGVEARLSWDEALVVGRGGAVGPASGVVTAGLSGTTLRFLAAVSLLAGAPVTVDGDPPLRRRPAAGLLEALERAGATVSSAGGRPPIVVDCPLFRGGRIVVDVSQSSQFLSALLLVSPYAAGDVELVSEGLGATGYVEMTVEAMRRWGAAAAWDGKVAAVRAGVGYTAHRELVEYDASSACHLFSLGLASGGAITVRNAGPTSQPDSRVVDLFRSMGAEVRPEEGGGTTVAAGAETMQAVDADMHETPDQVATVAVLAALAKGVSRLSGLSVVRGHETDRLVAVARELNKLGGKVEVEDDGLVVTGGRLLSGGLVETYNDHRMAFAFSALATAVPGIRIAAPGCVSKTYPGWWDELRRLGVPISADP